MSDRSRCGAVRIFYVAREPSAEIVRVESLSLWRHAHFLCGPRTLCGDCACRIALAAAPCDFFRGRRTLCGDRACQIALAVAPCEFFYVADEPSAEIVHVGLLSLWRRANFKARRRTLYGDCACQGALAVAPCGFQSSLTNPLRRLLVSSCFRCGAVRIVNFAGEPSAEIVSVGSLSLWFSHVSTKVVCEARSRSSGLRIASFKWKSSMRSTLRVSGQRIANFK